MTISSLHGAISAGQTLPFDSDCQNRMDENPIIKPPPSSSLLSRTRTDLDTHRSSLFYETIQKCVTGRFAFILALGEPWVFDYCPRRPANLIVIPVARRPRFSKSLPCPPPPFLLLLDGNFKLSRGGRSLCLIARNDSQRYECAKYGAQQRYL